MSSDCLRDIVVLWFIKAEYGYAEDEKEPEPNLGRAEQEGAEHEHEC